MLKLLRIPNLAAIVICQIIIRLALIKPILAIYTYEIQFGLFSFVLLILTTLFLTSAGYLINNYHDINIDITNKPDSIVIGKKVSPERLLNIYYIVNFTGLFFGVWVSIRTGVYILSIIPLIISLALWQYSLKLKMKLLLGNIVVAIFTAFVPLIVTIFEIPALISAYDDISLESECIKQLLNWTWACAFTAFMLTLAREISKDIEDIKGDKLHGRKSLPMYIKPLTTKLFLILILIIAIVFFAIFIFLFSANFKTVIYFILFIVMPTIVAIVKIIRAKNKANYQQITKLIGILIILGLGCLVIEFVLI